MSYSAPPNFTTGAIVTESQLDTLSDDITFLANPPTVRVNRSTDQTGIVTGTDTVVLFPNENFDTDTLHSTVTNTGRLTATTAGKYRIRGTIAWNNTATGVRTCRLRVNGTTVIDHDTDDASAGPHYVVLHVGTSYQLAAGDYVELIAFHNSGVNETLKVTDGAPHFEMTWEGV